MSYLTSTGMVVLLGLSISGAASKPKLAPCPEAYYYCRTHMAAATYDGVEPGLDQKLYYKYSHFQDGYPGGKHLILVTCGGKR